MRKIDNNPDYEDECEECPSCGSLNTQILNFFYPEPGDTDQRKGHQAECNDCEAFWDNYH